MEKSIEQIKSDLWSAAYLRNIADEKNREYDKKIGSGLSKVSVRKMYEQALYIENDLLPRLEKQRGKNNEDYIFFAEIFKSLLYAIVLSDRNEMQEMRFINLKLMNEFLTQRCEEQERHLIKYTTIEDFYLSTGNDIIARGVANRVRDLLKK